MYWQLNRIQYPIYNLGPGRRLGIWTQGCSLHCDGCLSPLLWDQQGGQRVNVERLAEDIIAVQAHFDGITITGGEPFEQYKPLLVFCSILKSYTDLDIFVFSGYTLAELVALYPDQSFMTVLDYLLDGHYKQNAHENQNVRGSSNQELYKFEQGIAVRQETYFPAQTWSVSVSESHSIFLTGIPKKDDLSTIIHQFADSGLTIRFE